MAEPEPPTVNVVEEEDRGHPPGGFPIIQEALHEYQDEIDNLCDDWNHHRWGIHGDPWEFLQSGIERFNHKMFEAHGPNERFVLRTLMQWVMELQKSWELRPVIQSNPKVVPPSVARIYRDYRYHPAVEHWNGEGLGNKIHRRFL